MWEGNYLAVCPPDRSLLGNQKSSTQKPHLCKHIQEPLPPWFLGDPLPLASESSWRVGRGPPFIYRDK
jgi:hypothetical protein